MSFKGIVPFEGLSITTLFCQWSTEKRSRQLKFEPTLVAFQTKSVLKQALFKMLIYSMCCVFVLFLPEVEPTAIFLGETTLDPSEPDLLSSPSDNWSARTHKKYLLNGISQIILEKKLLYCTQKYPYHFHLAL